VGVEGYEADDVIGTLATTAAARGLQAVIVSGDKDFYQLIGPGIALLNPGRGGPAAVEEQWVDQSNASARLGVPPERVIDYLALVGDSSDNIPGVKGVGEKTALELLKTLGDLDAILAGADRIPGKRARAAVQQHAELARLSRDLVTIRRDVPLPLDLEALRLRPPEVPRLTELFTELEFRSLIPKLGSLEGVGAGGPAPTGQRLAAVTAPPAPTALIVEPTIVDDPVALPSMLASFVLDPGRRSHAIDDLARERLSLQVQTYADVAGRGRSERPFAAVPLVDAARHACGDSETVLRLREAFRPELEDHQLLGL